MNKISCSIPILTLNCKKHLERLLPVVIAAFDDVFIMDGNSTDGTPEYARSLGLRVEKQFDTDEPNQRITNFYAMRLRLWSKAKYDWLLLLDADMEPTPELIELTRTVVAENNTKAAHVIPRYAQLPDGRIVKHALFYPNVYPHLFALSSGVKIAERAVHERLVFPSSVTLLHHTESIIDPWPSPQALWERQQRYLELAAADLKDGSVHYFVRWIALYHARSFFGQFLKAMRASIRGFLRQETALPWAYSAVFLGYLANSFLIMTRAWWKIRMSPPGLPQVP